MKITIGDLHDWFRSGDAWRCMQEELIYVPENDWLYHITPDGEVLDLSRQVKDKSYRETLSQKVWVDGGSNRVDFPLERKDIDYLDDSRWDAVDNVTNPHVLDNIVNLLSIGKMSMCGATNSENSLAKPLVSEQQRCSFYDDSIDGSHCTNWRCAYGGHCSSENAYIHKTGGTNFRLPRNPLVKDTDEDARNMDVPEANRRFNDRDLLHYVQSDDPHFQIFYCISYDAYCNGHARFLEKLTYHRRKHNLDPGDIPDRFIGKPE